MDFEKPLAILIFTTFSGFRQIIIDKLYFFKKQ